MTSIEKKQPNEGFIETGRAAYRMLIHISGNPHSKQPYKDLWDKGWRLERRKGEFFQPAQDKDSKRQPFKKTEVGDRKKPFQKRKDNRPMKGSPQRPQPIKAEPVAVVVDTNRLVNRFNNRFRTIA